VTDAMSAASAHLRYERKFIANGHPVAEVLALVRHHPAMFRETYPERVVNSLYLDTPGLRYYHEHVNGAANRLKVRIRWYGDLHGRAEQAALELKIRHGQLSRKETYTIPAIPLQPPLGKNVLETVRRERDTSTARNIDLYGLMPALVNRYRRRYFCTADGHVRLTVDWGLQFFAPHATNGSSLPHDGPELVLELKYGDAHAEDAVRIANAFPFRLSRCSKYVLGVEALGHG
jgi:hypothetical protein